MTTANEPKLPSFQNAEGKVTFLSGSPYPDNFHVGQAIDNGSCFFDSFKQSLEQQKGIEVTVERLRMIVGNLHKTIRQNGLQKQLPIVMITVASTVAKL